MDQLKTKNTSIEHSGIVKVIWRKLEIAVPKSEIIIGGVESIKD